ncbi:hypothetical protein [Trinickia sp. Y13]|uniref:hypothetical protein n=1 Tax=Trinickia sp. Y13 TaxID=2917807 RepID=UPI0024070ED2|nr:hypothetical protein [Trinickia sp. Y13]MDG0024953.1 hypothetical protein [Trinickia sp. Y13]
MKQVVDADPEVFDPRPSEAVKVIVSVLDSVYRDGEGPMLLISAAPEFLALQTYLSQAPKAALTAMATTVKMQLPTL